MLGSLGRSLIFLVLILFQFIQYTYAAEAQKNCQSFLDDTLIVKPEHSYVNFKVGFFSSYHFFAQALTEGLNLPIEKFSYAEKYFRDYFGIGIGPDVNRNSKDFKQKIERATDPKAMTKTVLGEILFRINRNKVVDDIAIIKPEARRRHKWVMDSRYVRLRPLTPFEQPFSNYLSGFSPLYSRHFDNRFFASVDEHFYYTLTNEKNQSLGEILVGIAKYNDVDEFGTTSANVAILHHISGVPMVALDQVFLGLFKIFQEEKMTLVIHQDYEDPSAYIDMPEDLSYEPPLLLAETDLEIASDPKTPEIVEDYIPIDKVTGVDRTQIYTKTRMYRASTHFDELSIYADVYDLLYGSGSLDEVLANTDELSKLCKKDVISLTACKKMLEATLYDTYLNFPSKFELLKTYIKVHASTYANYSPSLQDHSLFEEYWPLISTFNDDERPKVLKGLQGLHFDSVELDRFLKVLNEKLVYGIHTRFDLDSINSIFGGSKIVVSDQDRLPLDPSPPKVEVLESSYALRIRLDDLDYIERLLQSGLNPTRGLVIALAQKLIHPKFNISVDMVKLFITYGADVNFDVNSVVYVNGSKGWMRLTPGESFLSFSILLSRYDLVRVFVENDASLFENVVLPDAEKDLTNSQTMSLIEYADRLGYYDISEYLNDQMISDDE